MLLNTLLPNGASLAGGCAMPLGLCGLVCHGSVAAGAPPPPTYALTDYGVACPVALARGELAMGDPACAATYRGLLDARS